MKLNGHLLPACSGCEKGQRRIGGMHYSLGSMSTIDGEYRCWFMDKPCTDRPLPALAYDVAFDLYDDKYYAFMHLLDKEG